jgi:hypothetical protein
VAARSGISPAESDTGGITICRSLNSSSISKRLAIRHVNCSVTAASSRAT